MENLNLKSNKFKKGKTTKKKVEGITLIALVITIIVLLILAGVSISMLTGENGILKRAQEAKEKTEIATEDEQRKMAILEAATNTKNTEYTDPKTNLKIPIPAGFAPTRIEGESTIDEGIVIVDSKGNSYVWIEVPKTVEIYANTGVSVKNFEENTYKTIESDLKDYTSKYEMYGNYSDAYLDEWIEDCKIEKEEYNRLKKLMLKDIYINGGFWIGRYEAGYEGDVRYEPSNRYTNNIEKEIVVKEGAYPFNYICYPQAQKLANTISYENYIGSLMFGLQWDLVCKFIEDKNDIEIKDDSINWGNYRNAVFDITKGKYSSDDGQIFNNVLGKYTKKEYDTGKGILLTTGATKRNCISNIYDFAGNLWEYTLKLAKGDNIVYSEVRGGAYERDNTVGGAVRRGDVNFNACYAHTGFRITLINEDGLI